MTKQPLRDWCRIKESFYEAFALAYHGVPLRTDLDAGSGYGNILVLSHPHLTSRYRQTCKVRRKLLFAHAYGGHLSRKQPKHRPGSEKIRTYCRIACEEEEHSAQPYRLELLNIEEKMCLSLACLIPYESAKKLNREGTSTESPFFFDCLLGNNLRHKAPTAVQASEKRGMICNYTWLVRADIEPFDTAKKDMKLYNTVENDNKQYNFVWNDTKRFCYFELTYNNMLVCGVSQRHYAVCEGARPWSTCSATTFVLLQYDVNNTMIIWYDLEIIEFTKLNVKDGVKLLLL